MIFEAASKFVIVIVRIILGKVGIDRFTGKPRNIDDRYEFGLKMILNSLG